MNLNTEIGPLSLEFLSSSSAFKWEGVCRSEKLMDCVVPLHCLWRGALKKIVWRLAEDRGKALPVSSGEGLGRFSDFLKLKTYLQRGI